MKYPSLIYYSRRNKIYYWCPLKLGLIIFGKKGKSGYVIVNGLPIGTTCNLGIKTGHELNLLLFYYLFQCHYYQCLYFYWYICGYIYSFSLPVRFGLLICLKVWKSGLYVGIMEIKPEFGDLIWQFRFNSIITCMCVRMFAYMYFSKCPFMYLK